MELLIGLAVLVIVLIAFVAVGALITGIGESL
jgi:hypothetical protein